MLILVLFDVLQHPAQELKSIFRSNSRTFRLSVTSHELKSILVVWWCFCVGAFLWCQHPAREFVLFVVLQDCGFVVVFLVFCGGVDIRPENSYFSVFCKIVVRCSHRVVTHRVVTSSGLT